MKKIILIFGIILSMGHFAQAQGGRQMGSPAERADRQISQMESLKLSSEQKAQLKEVFIWSAEQMDSFRKANSGGDPQEMRAKIGPLQAETNSKVNALLNDEQKKAYQAILEERRGRMRNNN